DDVMALYDEQVLKKYAAREWAAVEESLALARRKMLRPNQAAAGAEYQQAIQLLEAAVKVVRAQKLILPLSRPINTRQAVAGLCFRPDGREIAVAWDRSVGTWDTITLQPGKERAVPIETLRLVRRIAYDADGRTVNIFCDQGVMKWQPASDEMSTRQFDEIAMSAPKISADGRVALLQFERNNLQVWDLKKNEPGPVLKHSSPIVSYDISGDGATIVTSETDKPDVTVWDAQTGMAQRRLPILTPDEPTGVDARGRPVLTRYTAALVLRPDGEDVAVFRFGAGAVDFFSTKDAKAKPRTVGQVGKRDADWLELAYSPDSARFVLGVGRELGNPRVNAQLSFLARVHHATTGEGISLLFPSGLRAMNGAQTQPARAFTADGRLMATAGDEGILRVVDLTTGDVSDEDVPLKRAVRMMVSCPTGPVIAMCSGDSVVQLWNLDPVLRSPWSEAAAKAE
ncbi:MAG: WD40 repeat domain-containing protein, partial [Phycisphaeraceae bacterium]